jgi:hypothetical protein
MSRAMKESEATMTAQPGCAAAAARTAAVWSDACSCPVLQQHAVDGARGVYCVLVRRRERVLSRAQVASGAQHYGKAADVFSFGLIVFDVYHGMMPFAELQPLQAAMKYVRAAAFRAQRWCADRTGWVPVARRAAGHHGARPVHRRADHPRAPPTLVRAAPVTPLCAQECWAQDPARRPTFDTVVEHLERALCMPAVLFASRLR